MVDDRICFAIFLCDNGSYPDCKGSKVKKEKLEREIRLDKKVKEEIKDDLT